MSERLKKKVQIKKTVQKFSVIVRLCVSFTFGLQTNSDVRLCMSFEKKKNEKKRKREKRKRKKKIRRYLLFEFVVVTFTTLSTVLPYYKLTL